jgi:hypothetical protein
MVRLSKVFGLVSEVFDSTVNFGSSPATVFSVLAIVFFIVGSFCCCCCDCCF